MYKQHISCLFKLCFENFKNTYRVDGRLSLLANLLWTIAGLNIEYSQILPVKR